MKPLLETWSEMSAPRRLGFALGLLLIVLTTCALAYWALRDPYVPVASQLSAQRMAQAVAELEKQKIPYRIAVGADTLEVPQASVGRARLALAGGAVPGGGVGLELFNDTDFSMTEFAQKVNYQRALQGELTRTIQAMEGVREARVHIVLAEGGVIRRQQTQASAAVTLAMAPGQVPTRAQVRGIQRLVAASVPEIRADDVTVLNESGVSLSGAGRGGEIDYSNAQLEMKREVDAYLEGKLRTLLEELAPEARVAASVDATLDFKQLKVTTEQPLAAPPGEPGEKAAGVVSRERQTQRSSGAAQDRSEGGGNEDTGWEYDYKVGQRIEQSLSMPGSVKRLSVAVALHGAPDRLDGASIERLVGHAVGLDSARGDAVTVVLLPAAGATGSGQAAAVPASGAAEPTAAELAPTPWAQQLVMAALLALLALAGVAALVRLGGGGRRDERQAQEAQEVALASARIRRWLGDGEGSHGR
ncbi:flagellar basal-body MS-ring/collar protein FliF [Aquabacterium sp. A7-Y]|uniref:flagellar basal-body MS-ring/collar protein FliF n=1 Tax=Aquabacterium sp. A7-Y TaxID=1349605 RepID=UPI00223D9F20|nr:flagellar basal-body MS-ring/collar protein FliF [Aquabacterium sp. A7-Y]MCW7540875.1 flagellar basal-body MS-ring/collar protein FliF [Aquabacterium sp. A7-Y]